MRRFYRPSQTLLPPRSWFLARHRRSQLRRKPPAAPVAARHRHLLRHDRRRSLPLPGGSQESRGRRMDEGTGRLHAQPRSTAFRSARHARRGITALRRCGRGTRLACRSIGGPRLLPEAQRRREHPQALRARTASAARSACWSIPTAARAGGQAQRDRLFPAVAGQQVPRVRNLGRRLGAERAARDRGRHAARKPAM